MQPRRSHKAGRPIYGHEFDRPPPLRRRLAELVTRLRPPRLRRYSFMVQNRLQRQAPAASHWLSAATLDQVLPGGLELMRRFVRPERMSDPDQLQRVCSLEYLFRFLGSRLVVD